MTKLESKLSAIRQVVKEYESDKLLKDHDFKRLHRKLSSAMFWVADERAKFKERWDEQYNKCQETTNAAKERFADRTVQELYLCRKVYDAAENVLISINNQLKY